MPDYSACVQFTCERRHACARYLMKQGRWQSVMAPKPPTCRSFWDASEGAPFKLLSPEEADQQAGMLDEPPEVLTPCDDAGGVTP